MTNHKPILLAFCEENRQAAFDIAAQLAQAGLTFRNIEIPKDSTGISLFQQLKTEDTPAFILLTDNFLRCVGCLQGGLELMQNQGSRFFYVVADGTRRSEESGELESIPTYFEKIGEIIKYLNYWQQRHIDFRKQQRLEGFADEESFNRHIQQVRNISSEIGEFLRLVRTGNTHNLNVLKQNNYEEFFTFLGIDRPEGFSVAEPSAHPASYPEDPTVESISDQNASTLAGQSTAQDSQIPQGSPLTPQEPPAHQLVEPPEDDKSIDDLLDDILDNQDKVGELKPESVSMESSLTHPSSEQSPHPAPNPLKAPAQIIIESENLSFQGKSEENLVLLTGAVADYPMDAQIRYLYALALVQDNFDMAEAVNQLRLILRDNPNHVDAQLLLGELYELQGKMGEARSTYEKLTADANAPTEAWFRLGKILIENFADQNLQAAHCFHKALDINPEFSDAYYELGNIASAAGDLETAENHYKMTLEHDSNHPFAWYDLALLLHRKEDAEAAYNAYQNAIHNNPELKTPQNDMSFDYHRQVRSSKAAEIIEKEQSALAEMRENLNRLEALLKEREEELDRLQEKTRHNQIVLITGATSGIGKATAILFAEKGYRLILTGRRAERLDALKAQLEQTFGADVITEILDVRDAQAVNVFIQSLPAEWAAIDLLINNAGKAKGLDPIYEGRQSHWDEMIDTNIKGLLYMTRAVSPQMVARRSGHIINVCSTAGKDTYPKGNVYCATKFAVDALTKSMRQDLYNHNVRVSQVSPAHVEETEFALVRFDGDADRAKIYDDFKPLSSQDVAEAIYFMASRPNHVDVLDIVMGGTQQANAFLIDRSGRNG